jgi:hypothetical protein
MRRCRSADSRLGLTTKFGRLASRPKRCKPAEGIREMPWFTVESRWTDQTQQGGSDADLARANGQAAGRAASDSAEATSLNEAGKKKSPYEPLAENKVTKRWSTGLVLTRPGPVYDFELSPMLVNVERGPGTLGDVSNALGAFGVAASKLEWMAIIEKLREIAGPEAAAALEALAKGAQTIGNTVGLIGVLVDGYIGLKYDSPGSMISAALSAGTLVTSVAVGGPVAAGVGVVSGLLGLYAGASVH